jgi:MAF protein
MLVHSSSLPYPLILASSSKPRHELLQKLCLPFETCIPDIDESPLPDEPPEKMVQRLAIEKAQAVAERRPAALIIASDQVAMHKQGILGKPLTHERALEYLMSLSGETTTFVNGLCLLNSATGHMQSDLVRFIVHFRAFNPQTAERYLQQEQPYQCAGAIRSEGLGISLFTQLEGSDPNALIGLPLIRLVDMLLQEGVQIP